MAQYIDIKEVSRSVGLSVTSIRRGIRTGRFPYIRSGSTPRGKLLFDLDKIFKVLETEEKKGAHNE